MKYLKLFEQVEDWDDPFGEETIPYEEGELFIMRDNDNVPAGDEIEFYLGHRKNGRIYMFNYPTPIYDNEEREEIVDRTRY